MNKGFKYFALIGQLGLDVMTPIILGYFIGMFLDGVFHTKYAFKLIFLVLGTISGAMNAYREIMIIASIKEKDKKKEEEVKKDEEQ